MIAGWWLIPAVLLGFGLAFAAFLSLLGVMYQREAARIRAESEIQVRRGPAA